MHRKREDPSFAPLYGMSPNQATPVLLELARRQVFRRRPVDLLRQFHRDGFVWPSVLDQRMVHRLDGLALAAAADFEALQLAPVAPLGACAVLAPTDQDRTLTATRGTEVVSDPTNILALECARRLREEPGAHVRLCTAHQVLRAQALPPHPGFSRHFRLFALAEAGRAQPEDGFEVRAIAEHLGVFDRLFDACAALELDFPGRRATVLTAEGEETLGARVCDALAAALPHVELRQERLASRYYQGVRVLFAARSAAGELIPIADTGRFDWVARLAANRRLRYVASGIGIQLAPLLFRKLPAP